VSSCATAPGASGLLPAAYRVTGASCQCREHSGSNGRPCSRPESRAEWSCWLPPAAAVLPRTCGGLSVSAAATNPATRPTCGYSRARKESWPQGARQDIRGEWPRKTAYGLRTQVAINRADMTADRLMGLSVSSVGEVKVGREPDHREPLNKDAVHGTRQDGHKTHVLCGFRTGSSRENQG